MIRSVNNQTARRMLLLERLSVNTGVKRSVGDSDVKADMGSENHSPMLLPLLPFESGWNVNSVFRNYYERVFL